MFEGWDEFYLLIGAADGALIGLLFVVTTLSANMRMGPETASRAAAFYMTPTLFHFLSVLVLSALAAVPGASALWVAIVLGGWALFGAGYSAVMAAAMRWHRVPVVGEWRDVWCYGLLPLLVYLALCATAWIAWRDAPQAPYAIAIGLVTLMVIGIRNAWDLVMFIVPRTVERPE